MYNWRLLLLAFTAIFQPIASFTERNLVDGRHQCCDHRLERDSPYTLSPYGDSRLKLSSEDQRVTSQRRETREAKRDERLDVPSLARLARNSVRVSKESELRRSLVLEPRSSRIESQREREPQSRIRNVVASEDRGRNARETLTRTDRIRIAHRSPYTRNSRVLQISRESINRVKRDATETIIRLTNEHRTNYQETIRMKTPIDDSRRSRDREGRVETRRMRDTERNLDRAERSTEFDRRTESAPDRRVYFERKQRNIPSSERLSSRRTSFETERFIENQRNARAESRENLANENERRSIELKVRDRVEFDQKISGRSPPKQLDISRDRRSISRSIEMDGYYRTANYDNRAYEINDLRNVITYRGERRVQKRNTYERRSIAVLRAFNDNTRDLRSERLLPADRTYRARVNIREDNRERSNVNVRSAIAEDRREVQRSSRLDSKIAENDRSNRALRSRQSEADEYRRTASERISRQTRDIREQSRLSFGNRFVAQNTDSRRSLGRREDSAESDERTQRFRERIAEDRLARENQPRLDATGFYRSAEGTRQRNTRNEKMFRERASSVPDRFSLNDNVREIVRDNEKRHISRDNSMQRENLERSNIVPARNERHFRERALSESGKLSANKNVREISRDTDRRQTRNTDITRDTSRDVTMRRIQSRQRSDAEFTRYQSSTRIERQFRERTTSESRRPSPATFRDISLETERRETSRNDRTRESNEVAMRRIESQRISTMDSARNLFNTRSERQYRELTASEARSSPETIREISRDNDRRETRNADRRRETPRNVSMRRIESRSRSTMDAARNLNTNIEREFRDMATSESRRLLSRTNVRENSRNTDRRETRITDRTSDASRDSVRRIESRIRSNVESARQQLNTRVERQFRDRAMSETRMPSQYVRRDIDRMEIRNTERTREYSRDISTRRIESRIRSNMDSERNYVTMRDESQLRERAMSESSRLSLRTNTRKISRDNERKESQNTDRSRDARDSRENRMVSAINHLAVISQKVENENQTKEFNWQHLLYTLQGIYLCSIFMPMLLAKNTKKTMSFGGWAPFQGLIKMD